MERHLAVAAVLCILGATLMRAESEATGVQSVRFKTSTTAPVYVVPKSLRQHESLLRAGLEYLPESLIVVGALTVGSRDLALPEKEASSVGPLMADVYLKIANDPVFRGTPSALPYCFATQKQTTGHYFLYRPPESAADPLSIVFLHGFGGNFHFYMWALKNAFPHAVILAPSWGVSWAEGTPAYVNDMLADARRRLSVPLRKPWLIAISAGGHGGFTIYSQHPNSFAGYVCLASVPGTSVLKRLQPSLKILMLNGTADSMVPIALARKQAELARRVVPSLRLQEIEGDHFFLLSRQEDTFRAIRQFMERRADSPDASQTP